LFKRYPKPSYNKADPTLESVSNPWSIFGLGIRILNLHEEIVFNGVLQQEEQPPSDMQEVGIPFIRK